MQLCDDVSMYPPGRGQRPVLSPPGSADTGQESPSAEPLGTYTKTCNPPLDRWGLLTAVQEVLPRSHRVNNCFRKRVSSDGSVDIVKGVDDRYHYKGLQTCGSVWVCPICSARVSRKRQQELKAALDSARSQGLRVFMLTLTAPHTIADDIGPLLAKLTTARRLLRNRKVWKRLASSWGLAGSVRDLEVMHGANGWHVHFHELLFVTGDVPDSDYAEVLEAWQAACITAKLDAPNSHGVDIRDGSAADRYVAKWGFAEEITLSHSKTGQTATSYTPWGLLARAAYGEKYARDLFRAYALAINGKRQLVWSDGLRDLLGLGVELTDEELSKEEVCGVTVARMSDLGWHVVVNNDARGDLLAAFNEGGMKGGVLFLLALGIDIGLSIGT